MILVAFINRKRLKKNTLIKDYEGISADSSAFLFCKKNEFYGSSMVISSLVSMIKLF